MSNLDLEQLATVCGGFELPHVQLPSINLFSQNNGPGATNNVQQNGLRNEVNNPQGPVQQNGLINVSNCR
jgi:hypothetical protein